MTGQSGGTINGAAGGVLGGSYPTPTFASNGTTALLGYLLWQLPSDVTIGSVNTFVDGPTLAVTVGTWLVLTSLTVALTGTTNATLKLWDGTTAFASTIQTEYTSGYSIALSASGIYVATGTVTLRAAVALSAGTGAIVATAGANPAGATASSLIALRIA